jgi:hypothetical protein
MANTQQVTSANTQQPAIPPIIPGMKQIWQQALSYTQQQQVEQDADNAVVRRNVKATADALNTADQQQNAAIVQKQQADDDLSRRIASGVNTIDARYGGNVGNDSSAIAQNDVKLQEIHQRILQQYDAITNLQSDNSVLGGIGQMFALPGMLKGMDILSSMHDAIQKDSADALQRINNEHAILKDSLTSTDVAGAAATHAITAAAAQSLVDREHLTSIGQQAAILDSARRLNLDINSRETDEKTNAILKPLEVERNKAEIARARVGAAIDQARLDEITKNNAFMSDIASTLGYGNTFKAQQFVRSIPSEDLHAIVAFQLSGGKLSNPNDGAIIKHYINDSGAVNADGSPNAAAKFVQNFNRVQPQLNTYNKDYADFLNKTYGTQAGVNADPQRLNALLAEKVPDAAVKAAFIADQEKLGRKTVGILNDANPNKVLQLLPADVVSRIPLITTVANSLGETELNVPDGKLLEAVYKGNHNASPVDIANQIHLYMTARLKVDQANPIWGATGLPKPGAATGSVEVPGLLQRFGLPGGSSNIEPNVNMLKHADILNVGMRVQAFDKAKTAAAQNAAMYANLPQVGGTPEYTSSQKAAWHNTAGGSYNSETPEGVIHNGELRNRK